MPAMTMKKMAIAILPLLGVGGRQAFRAETPGPIKEGQLTPRIADTAKGLWIVYCLLTAACMLAFWLGGMTQRGLRLRESFAWLLVFGVGVAQIYLFSWLLSAH